MKTLTSRDPDVIKKFHEEAELMKKFSHPNIVSLLGKRTAIIILVLHKKHGLFDYRIHQRGER